MGPARPYRFAAMAALFRATRAFQSLRELNGT
jgi:hypothetical protein